MRSFPVKSRESIQVITRQATFGVIDVGVHDGKIGLRSITESEQMAKFVGLGKRLFDTTSLQQAPQQGRHSITLRVVLVFVPAVRTIRDMKGTK